MTAPTREQVIEWVRKSGVAKHGLGYTAWEGQLERFAALAYAAGQAAERAAAIRARGECDHPKAKTQYTGDGTPVSFCPDCGRNEVAGRRDRFSSTVFQQPYRCFDSDGGES